MRQNQYFRERRGKLSKHLVIIVAALFFYSPNLFALEFNKDKLSVSTSPTDLLDTVINGAVESRLEEKIAAGIGAFTWNMNTSGYRFNSLGLGPYARYYGMGEQDGWYAGAGFQFVSYSWSGYGQSGSGSNSGISLEGGYQWRWTNFFHEVGYGLWLVGVGESSSGGAEVDFGDLGGVGYRLGWYF